MQCIRPNFYYHLCQPSGHVWLRVQTLPVCHVPALSHSVAARKAPGWPPSHHSVPCQASLTQSGSGPAGPDGHMVIYKCLQSSCRGSEWSSGQAENYRWHKLKRPVTHLYHAHTVSRQCLSTKPSLFKAKQSYPLLASSSYPQLFLLSQLFQSDSRQLISHRIPLKSLGPDLPGNPKPTSWASFPKESWVSQLIDMLQNKNKAEHHTGLKPSWGSFIFFKKPEVRICDTSSCYKTKQMTGLSSEFEPTQGLNYVCFEVFWKVMKPNKVQMRLGCFSVRLWLRTYGVSCGLEFSNTALCTALINDSCSAWKAIKCMASWVFGLRISIYLLGAARRAKWPRRGITHNERGEFAEDTTF